MISLDAFETRSRADAGVDMPVMLPDGTPAEAPDGTPVVITLHGTDSQACRRALDSLYARLEAADTDPDQTEAEILAACTKDWRGFRDATGPVPCTLDNARRIYADYPVIREQAAAFITDDDSSLEVPEALQRLTEAQAKVTTHARAVDKVTTDDLPRAEAEIVRTAEEAEQQAAAATEEVAVALQRFGSARGEPRVVPLVFGPSLP